MKETLRLCFVLTLIGAVCAGVLAFVNQRTEGPIRQALAAEKGEGVTGAMPAAPVSATNDSTMVMVRDSGFTRDSITVKDKDGGKELTFHRNKKGGVPIGATFKVVAPNGYGGDIEILVGVDTACVVTKVDILKHAETQGLGSKITTPLFKGQFVGKSIKNPPKWAVMKDGGTFKQITGATISSRAVAAGIASGLEFLEAHKAEVFGAPKAGAATKSAVTAPSGMKISGGG
jgi:electron transport complex protein RnfG